MPRSKVLSSVDSDGSLFGDAGTDAIGTLDRFGPDPTKPGSPIAEALRRRVFPAMFDRNTCRVTEEHGVSGLANQTVQPIDLLLRTQKQVFERQP